MLHHVTQTNILRTKAGKIQYKASLLFPLRFLSALIFCFPVQYARVDWGLALAGVLISTQVETWLPRYPEALDMRRESVLRPVIFPKTIPIKKKCIMQCLVWLVTDV